MSTTRRFLLFGGLLGLTIAVVAGSLLVRGAEQRTEPRSEEQARPSPRAPAPDSPESTVRAFYQRLGRRDFAGAWDLAGPEFKRRVTFLEYERRHEHLRSVVLGRADPVREGRKRATVAVWAILQERAEIRCKGTQELMRAPDGGWLVEPTVQCRPAGPSRSGPAAFERPLSPRAG